jgi:molybdopterin-guanine dinucleotide biosynthesis protein A
MTSIENKMSLLNGLVLAGGKGKRLGRDKGLIKWQSKEQRYLIADILKAQCEEVFISCRADQRAEILENYRSLPDTFLDLGPYGGILSALRAQPDRAWLVVACDLPLLDADTIQFLIANRNRKTIATTFKSPHDGLPEPLITIWEPESYPVLLSFLAKQYSCPRKVLLNSETTVLEPPNPDALMNVNTPEDAEKAEAILRQRAH